LGPPPLVREFGQRIRDAIGYQSPAVASAIQTDLNRALDAGFSYSSRCCGSCRRSAIPRF
jgi:hypothetical protein